LDAAKGKTMSKIRVLVGTKKAHSSSRRMANARVGKFPARISPDGKSIT
jgi:hypothetical protein